MIDQVTGEIIEDTYMDIDSVEAELFKSIGSELDHKLVQTRLLITINDRQLYRQRLDESGEPYPSFSAYLKSIASRLGAAGMGKLRSLQNSLVCYKVYIQGLGYPESFLREMGSHAVLMLAAAARHIPTSKLEDNDEPTDTGGRRLGKESFASFTEEIREKVAGIDTDIPESSWTTEDTKAVVDELLGKDDDKVKLSISAHWVGKDIKLERLTFWIGSYAYQVGDIIPVDHFRKITKGASVEGVGSDWRR